MLYGGSSSKSWKQRKKKNHKQVAWTSWISLSVKKIPPKVPSMKLKSREKSYTSHKNFLQVNWFLKVIALISNQVLNKTAEMAYSKKSLKNLSFPQNPLIVQDKYKSIVIQKHYMLRVTCNPS
jgi:coproporphyrinogen III oxidase